MNRDSDLRVGCVPLAGGDSLWAGGSEDFLLDGGIFERRICRIERRKFDNLFFSLRHNFKALASWCFEH